jgi:hypothetical protein
MSYPKQSVSHELQFLKTVTQHQTVVLNNLHAQVLEQAEKINELVVTVNKLTIALNEKQSPAKEKRFTKKELQEQALAGIKSAPFIVNVAPATMQ